jgi:hypothetical protein
MAHGEAEHGCAQGEPCRTGHDQPAVGKHPRRLTGLTHPEQHTAERAEEDPAVPRQRDQEPVPPVGSPSAQGCRSELAGWAGAHRHGAVRPRARAIRRERPPRRWC